MPTKISILVYMGSPLDYIEYRHTALFIEFRSGSTSIMHVTGTHGLFQFEETSNYNPDLSRSLAKTIAVAELQDTISAASISTIISNTLVKNERQDADWNCQNWVGDALTRLVDYGYLNTSQRATAIDKMTDACLEARDE